MACPLLKRLLPAVCCLPVLCFTAPCVAIEIVPIAVIDQPVPGLPGHTFTSLSDQFYEDPNFSPQINHRGDIAFFAETQDSTGGEALYRTFLRRNQELDIVLSVGNLLPGEGPDARVTLFRALSLSETGKVAVRTTSRDHIHSGPLQRLTTYGIWTGDGDSLTKVVQANDPFPGSDPINAYWTVLAPKINSSGDVAFMHRDFYGRSFFGLSSSVSGSVQVQTQGVYRHNTEPFEIDEQGRTLYFSSDIGGRGQRGSFLLRDHELLVSERDHFTVSTPTGRVTKELDRFRAMAFSRSGSYALLAESTEVSPNPGIPGISNLVGEGGSLREVASKGQQAPGLPTEATFSELMIYDLNETGNVLFETEVVGGAEDYLSLWADREDGLQLVAKIDAPTPGVAGRTFDRFDGAQMNASGQVVLYGSYIAEDSQRRGGLWVQNPGNELRLIAGEGTQIEVAPGIVKTVVTAGFPAPYTPYEYVSAPFLNDRGQLLFSAGFEDGTRGYFVATLAPVPEPTTLGMLLMLGGLPLRSHHT